MERGLNGRSHGVWGVAMRNYVGLNVVVVFSEFDLCARNVADMRESARRVNGALQFSTVTAILREGLATRPSVVITSIGESFLRQRTYSGARFLIT